MGWDSRENPKPAETCLLTTPSFLSSGTRSFLLSLGRPRNQVYSELGADAFIQSAVVSSCHVVNRNLNSRRHSPLKHTRMYSGKRVWLIDADGIGDCSTAEREAFDVSSHRPQKDLCSFASHIALRGPHSNSGAGVRVCDIGAGAWDRGVTQSKRVGASAHQESVSQRSADSCDGLWDGRGKRTREYGRRDWKAKRDRERVCHRLQRIHHHERTRGERRTAHSSSTYRAGFGHLGAKRFGGEGEDCARADCGRHAGNGSCAVEGRSKWPASVADGSVSRTAARRTGICVW